jgi:hypothetical protein
LAGNSHLDTFCAHAYPGPYFDEYATSPKPTQNAPFEGKRTRFTRIDSLDRVGLDISAAEGRSTINRKLFVDETSTIASPADVRRGWGEHEIRGGVVKTGRHIRISTDAADTTRTGITSN